MSQHSQDAGKMPATLNVVLQATGLHPPGGCDKTLPVPLPEGVLSDRYLVPAYVSISSSTLPSGEQALHAVGLPTDGHACACKRSGNGAQRQCSDEALLSIAVPKGSHGTRAQKQARHGGPAKGGQRRDTLQLSTKPRNSERSVWHLGISRARVCPKASRRKRRTTRLTWDKMGRTGSELVFGVALALARNWLDWLDWAVACGGRRTLQIDLPWGAGLAEQASLCPLPLHVVARGHRS